MNTKNRQRTFETALGQLASWFERQRRILPWRENPDTYRVWISEIMLQQTQVGTVVPYFEKFMKRFPNLKDLAHAPEDEVLLHWAGLGYYSRARNIHRAAKILFEAGRFPRTREQWLEVPGVGPYTAGAILSISMNLPEAILDGNVERVVSRVRRISRSFTGDAVYKRRLWRLSRIFVERAHGLSIQPSVTNQALMELGATVCSPKAPRCELCPLASICKAKKCGDPEKFPSRKKAKEWLEVEERLCCCIDREGRVLLGKRKTGEWRAGLWDLPIAEGVQQWIGACRLVGEVKSNHIVTRHRITRTTQVWRLEKWGAAESGIAESELRWVSPLEPQLAMGSALKKTLSRIRETFPEVWPTS